MRNSEATEGFVKVGYSAREKKSIFLVVVGVRLLVLKVKPKINIECSTNVHHIRETFCWKIQGEISHQMLITLEVGAIGLYSSLGPCSKAKHHLFSFVGRTVLPTPFGIPLFSLRHSAICGRELFGNFNSVKQCTRKELNLYSEQHAAI